MSEDEDVSERRSMLAETERGCRDFRHEAGQLVGLEAGYSRLLSSVESEGLWQQKKKEEEKGRR